MHRNTRLPLREDKPLQVKYLHSEREIITTKTIMAQSCFFRSNLSEIYNLRRLQPDSKSTKVDFVPFVAVTMS
jgi:hypothetical protein